jgi:hypothetical protein
MRGGFLWFWLGSCVAVLAACSGDKDSGGASDGGDGAADDGATDGAADGGADGGVDPNDQDGDGVAAAEDCDDNDASVGGPADYYTDMDGDGAGADTSAVSACVAPEGAVAVGGDCDDADPALSPTAVEVCDGIDNDCDLLVDGDDSSVDLDTVRLTYADADLDGVGLDGSEAYTCDDGVGRADVGGDCDDADPSVGAATLWYADQDLDGFGDPATAAPACTAPADVVDNGLDCDDLNEDTNPEALEICDGADNDCDGLTDDADDSLDLGLAAPYYVDADGDGFGDGEAAGLACAAPPGFAAADGDCDDGELSVNPGAVEVCGDGLDSDCDGGPGAWCVGGALSSAEAARSWSGTAASDEAGRAIDSAGDLDGDGYDDLLVGAALYDGVGSSSGQVTVVYGGPDATSGSLGDRPGWLGSRAYDYLGGMVAGVGDVNGDGIDDAVLSSRGADRPVAAAGAAYLVLGGPRHSGLTDVAGLAEATLTGVSGSDGLGESIAPAGDTDGDGFADFLVGARDADPSGRASAGSVWLVYGDPGTLVGELSVSGMARFDGLATNDYLGSQLSLGGGDLDGDGLSDFYAGAYGVDISGGATLQGAVYLWSGDAARRAGASDVGLADGTISGAPFGSGSSQLGYAVSRRAADVNGDGYADLLAGAYYYDEGGTDAGAAFLYLGGPSAVSSERSMLTGAAARFVGEERYEYCAKAVDLVEDADGDGRAEVWVGCYGWDSPSFGAGRAALFFGAASLPVSNDISEADLILNGVGASDNLGHTAASLDLNGDGFGDLAAGAYGENSGAGGVHLIFGGAGFGLGL